MLIWIVKCRYNWYKTQTTNGDILFTKAWGVTGIRYPINSSSKWWCVVFLDLFLTCENSNLKSTLSYMKLKCSDGGFENSGIDNRRFNSSYAIKLISYT